MITFPIWKIQKVASVPWHPLAWQYLGMSYVRRTWIFKVREYFIVVKLWYDFRSCTKICKTWYWRLVTSMNSIALTRHTIILTLSLRSITKCISFVSIKIVWSKWYNSYYLLLSNTSIIYIRVTYITIFKERNWFLVTAENTLNWKSRTLRRWTAKYIIYLILIGWHPIVSQELVDIYRISNRTHFLFEPSVAEGFDRCRSLIRILI